MGQSSKAEPAFPAIHGQIPLTSVIAIWDLQAGFYLYEDPARPRSLWSSKLPGFRCFSERGWQKMAAPCRDWPTDALG